MKIELVKVPDDSAFGRGERAIMVDGVRWGRTIVTFHGCHGAKHCFEQEGRSGVIEARPGQRYPGEENVWPGKRRKRWSRDDEHLLSTEQAVLAKVRELIAAGKLRHPDIVKAEVEAEIREWREENQRLTRANETAFRSKAEIAIDPIRECLTSEQSTGLVDRVVTAMRWAQTQ